jgi:zinc/manganese transport system permease protein
MTTLELDILLPALVAGLLILATHIPLGMRVLQRGVIFADLAIAQIAGLGVILTALLELNHKPLLVQIIAASSALCGAVLLTWIERFAPEVKEACIGITFVLAASLGILLMSHDVHAGEHLKDLLVGQIIWVSTDQLIGTAILTIALLVAWHTLRNSQSHFAFYGLFALAVTASVQLVGIYLVFASLIVPALATYKIKHRRVPLAYAVGVMGYVLGLLVSVWFDLPAGAAIVWTMALVAILLNAIIHRQKSLT